MLIHLKVAKMYGERRELIGQSSFSKAARPCEWRTCQDDPVAMDFVHCAANLRMQNYRRSEKTLISRYILHHIM